MTERIDLDDMDAAEEQDDEETPNRGDWFWKGEGDPDDEPGAASWRSGDGSDADESDADAVPGPAERAADAAREAEEDASTSGGPDAAVRAGDAHVAGSESTDTDPVAETDPADEDADAGTGGDDDAADADRPPASPHVPSETEGSPAGIPVSQGGGGAGSSSRAAGGDAADAEAGDGDGTETEARASGPHGGGADDMTTTFTYRAAKRLAAPAAAFADAEQWSDWIGIVGDVDAHVLGTFQRNHTIDADFFNGSGTGPAERLAGIDAHSMFYADRMVVVGVEGDEAIAEEAGWEFVPLEDAAEGAGWDLVDPDEDDGDGVAGAER